MIRAFEEFTNGEAIHHYKSSFAEIRDNKKKRLDTTANSGEVLATEKKEILKHTGTATKNPRGFAVDSVHSHPDIKPTALSDIHIKAIKNYTTSPRENFSDFTPTPGHNSRAMNSYLRDGEAGNRKPSYEGQNYDTIRTGIRNLTSAFTPENTNRAPIHVFTGVPASIGRGIASSNALSTHKMPGFTSYTTDKNKAIDFAEIHNEEAKEDLDEPRHVIKVMARPSTLLSAAYHSHASDSENELIAKPGSFLMYHSSDYDPIMNVTTHNMTM